MRIPEDVLARLRACITSRKVTDYATLSTMRRVYERHGYLMDPHTAVAVAALHELGGGKRYRARGEVTVVLSTAHPAKFPKVVATALGRARALPPAASHHTIDSAAQRMESLHRCDCADLEEQLGRMMLERRRALTSGFLFGACEHGILAGARASPLVYCSALALLMPLIACSVAALWKSRS